MMKMCELLEMEHLDKGKEIAIGNRDKKSIFFLKKGAVKILNSTHNTTKYVVKKGNIFGELSLYDEQAAAMEKAITLEESIICYIQSDMMEELMEKHKSLKNGVFKVYGLRIKKLERRLEDLLYKDSKTRIADFIYAYVKEFGEDKLDRIEAKNLLSHKDIANLTNTSRQTVNNVLSTLRKEKRIDYNTREIAIFKPMLEE
ncbi:Crp/Fnr family transcriptional regulator [Flagellimonas algicola]|nr:Crp/Fnr family transcriptional regulator [Allomuricauda algicola]